MKNTGVIRRLDELGRITLPMELRKSMNLKERDALQISVDNGRVVLEKYTPCDIFTVLPKIWSSSVERKFPKAPSANWQNYSKKKRKLFHNERVAGEAMSICTIYRHCFSNNPFSLSIYSFIFLLHPAAFYIHPA